MIKALYNEQPDAVTYMRLPNGEADVWLRKDIAETEQQYENEALKLWEAKEVYFRTADSKAAIEADFEKYYAQYAYDKPTTEERLEALEAVMLEVMEAME